MSQLRDDDIFRLLEGEESDNSDNCSCSDEDVVIQQLEQYFQGWSSSETLSDSRTDVAGWEALEVDGSEDDPLHCMSPLDLED
ncbi:hypothetical protein FQA39_LY00577 [Lamprigera yunnana]|nr:hypothetical protein FQA39_LY00577 [Lamprigera yunnana]